MNHIVLFQPEIPQNTGNIIRTCQATKTELHIIKPLGFSIDDKELKRSSVNYAHDFSFSLYESLEDFFKKNEGEYFFLTRYGLKKHTDFDYSDSSKNYYFFLGKESTGLPLDLLKKNIDKCLRVPMAEDVRALNVSNTAAIIIYEVLRQQNFNDLSLFEPESLKGKNHIIEFNEEN